jgi:hypothetical protein
MAMVTVFYGLSALQTKSLLYADNALMDRFGSVAKNVPIVWIKQAVWRLTPS